MECAIDGLHNFISFVLKKYLALCSQDSRDRIVLTWHKQREIISGFLPVQRLFQTWKPGHQLNMYLLCR